NLPPAPIADDTYPIPDANNPFADPNFPFANPPYAARAYSYVSAAQYDALKATWYYKFLYNRPAPASTDPSIKVLMPATNLPSYPPGAAGGAGATRAMLGWLFRGGVGEIPTRPPERRRAALLPGRATASDIAAGLALGNAVAAVFVTRARADGMGAAV